MSSATRPRSGAQRNKVRNNPRFHLRAARAERITGSDMVRHEALVIVEFAIGGWRLRVQRGIDEWVEEDKAPSTDVVIFLAAPGQSLPGPGYYGNQAHAMTPIEARALAGALEAASRAGDK